MPVKECSEHEEFRDKWNGKEIMVEKCVKADSAIFWAHDKGDTVYVSLIVDKYFRNTIYYQNNEPERVDYDVYTSDGFKSNITLTPNNASKNDGDIKIINRDEEYIYLALGDNYDSAVYVQSFERFPYLNEIEAYFKQDSITSFINGNFKLPIREIANNQKAAFLMYFTLEGQEGIGAMPFYLDSVMIDWYLNFSWESPENGILHP